MKPLLIISHFTKNKGTTDYFLEYLRDKKIPYYYLRHPFNFTDLEYSELIYFDSNKEEILQKYKKIKNSIIDLFRNFRLSYKISKKLNKEVDMSIGFGSFNTVPLIYSKGKSNRKVYFWGVDYSRKRFGNPILNKIYLYIETIACKRSDLVIQPTKRQEDSRIQYHKLIIDKSLIISNGINNINFNKDFSKFKDISLIYIGSITPQHGIIEFIEEFYINKAINIPLYIIGGGDKEEELIELIKINNLENNVHFLGFLNQYEIIEFLLKIKERLFGLAPYSDKMNDHVYYGDSLKIKEYLNYNIPFLTNNVTYITDEILEFGYIYDNFEKVREFLMSKAKKFKLNISNKNKILSKYKWDLVLNKIPLN